MGSRQCKYSNIDETSIPYTEIWMTMGVDDSTENVIRSIKSVNQMCHYDKIFICIDI